MPTDPTRANEGQETHCAFCGAIQEPVGAFIPDRWGGYWHVKPCPCEGATAAREASRRFRKLMAG